MEATIRDFSITHPDFQSYNGGLSYDLVKLDLGPDNKPVFNSTTGSNNGNTLLTSETRFNEWYNTTPGVNHEFHTTLQFTSDNNGMVEYINSNFFPLSGSDGWGLEGNPHNFHFTTEIHFDFTYIGGEIFEFSGDDDLWLFIDRKLVIDLGGVHGATTDSVEIDDLGLIIGNDYTMDIFHAERHTGQSNFTIRTNVRRCIPVVY